MSDYFVHVLSSYTLWIISKYSTAYGPTFISLSADGFLLVSVVKKHKNLGMHIQYGSTGKEEAKISRIPLHTTNTGECIQVYRSLFPTLQFYIWLFYLFKYL